MKKVFAFLCAAVILCLSGCKSPASPSPQTDPTETVSQPEQTALLVDVTASVPARAVDAVLCDMGEIDMTSPIRTDAEKFQEPGAVVIHGVVADAHYVLQNGTVFTRSDVKVLTCYQGDLAEGSLIGVMELGGFIPSDVYNNAMYQEKSDTDAPADEPMPVLDMRARGFKVMEAGEEVILFLVPYMGPKTEEFHEGCYELIRVWQGKLLYDESVGAFVPYVPDFELSPLPESAREGAVQIKNIGTAENGILARTYTLDEFASFAAGLRATDRA